MFSWWKKRTHSDEIEPVLDEAKLLRDGGSHLFNTDGGAQNVSTGSSMQHNNVNQSSATMNNFTSIRGTPTFNLGKS